MQRTPAPGPGFFADLGIPALHGGLAGLSFVFVALLGGGARLADLVAAQLSPAGAAAILAAGALEIGAMVGFVLALLGLGVAANAHPTARDREGKRDGSRP